MTFKTHRLIGLFALFFIATRLHAATTVADAPSAGINIQSPPAVSELAAGYAAAAAQMTTKLLVIHYSDGTKTGNLRAISTVRAYGGVLLITLSAGDKIALSADRILRITDSPRADDAPKP